MIIEALQHFFNPAAPYVKKMGYLREAIATNARAGRCHRHWQPHLRKCKTLILEAAAKLPSRSGILILGSGGLHDVPVEELLAQGHALTCVDIVQMAAMRKKYPEITFVTEDLTGIAERLYQQRGKGQFTAESYAPEWVPEAKPALVISLNLLSQLSVIPDQFAARHDISLAETFDAQVRAAHVAWLEGLGVPVLLISDIDRRYFHEGEHIKTTSALSAEELGKMGAPCEQWLWNIAPAGEADSKIGIEHTVGVWKL